MSDEFDDLEEQDEGGRSLLGGVIAGALGGIAGVWVLAQVDDILEMTLDESKLGRKARASRQARRDDPSGVELSAPDKPAIRAARSIADIAGYDLTDEQARKAAPAMEYGLGAALGALYGGLTEYAPSIAAGRGSLFGLGLWAGMDLFALPRFGLTDPPEGHVAVTHARAYARRAAWGLTTDTVRRMVRALF